MSLICSVNSSEHFTAEKMFQLNHFCKTFSLTTANSGSEGDILHSHDYMQIWYVTRGLCNHWIEGYSHDMVSGEAFILPPNMVHKTKLGPNTEILCSEFSLDYFLPERKGNGMLALKEKILDFSFMDYFMVAEDDVKPKLSLSPKHQSFVENLMRSMLTEYSCDEPFSIQFLQTYIIQLLLIFAREYHDMPTQREAAAVLQNYKILVQDAIAFIDAHYSEALHLEEICKLFMVSKTYFCYIFKLLTQRTFVEYVLNLRIHKAMVSLSQTNESITDICYNVGFNDLAHFSRTFKKIVGVSARTYRNLRADA